MSIRVLRVAVPGLALALAPLGESIAHEIVGNRFFPATIGIDDPGVNDELSFPTVANFKTGDDSLFRQRDFSGEFSKRITEAFAISFGSTFAASLHRADRPRWEQADFRTWRPRSNTASLKNPEHEFVMSVGLSVEWGGTGAQSVGADPFHTYTPTIWFGKGFGDLPDTLSWIRPVAVTGQIGYAIPARRSTTTFGIDQTAVV